MAFTADKLCIYIFFFLMFNAVRQKSDMQIVTSCRIRHINHLKPTGHVMHQQFNIQQLYILSTMYLFVLYLSENKQRLVPLTA